MSRYRPMYPAATTVSQEGVLLIFAGLVAFVHLYDYLKKVKNKNDAAQDVKAKAPTYAERIETLLNKAKAATEINPETVLYYEYLDVKATAKPSDVISSVRKIITTFGTLIKNAAPVFDSCYDLSDKWDAGTAGEDEDVLDKEGARMTALVVRHLKPPVKLYGHSFTLQNGSVHVNEPNKGFGQDTAEVASPTRSQYDALLKQAIELLELCTELERYGVADYMQEETMWVYYAQDICNNALNALVVYIEKSLK